MTIVPETRAGKIQFYEIHVPVWADDPVSIGLSAAAVDELRLLVEDARAALQSHQQAEQEARTATMRFHNAVRRMHGGGEGIIGGATLIQLIKAHAQVTGDAGVYFRAMIPMAAKPGRPGSTPAPGTPDSFSVSLSQVGEIELTWKCDNPDGTVGTVYQVRRKVDDEPLAAIAMVGEKRFVDRALPPGTKVCMYEVTAMRSTGKGSPGVYTINFGNAHPLPQQQVKSRRLVA